MMFANSDILFDKKKNIYESGTKTEKSYLKETKFKNKAIKIFLGLDENNKISEISVLGNLTNDEFEQIGEIVVQGTCVTDCSRKNRCSDKPTNVGSGGCYAECVIDCAADLIASW